MGSEGQKRHLEYVEFTINLYEICHTYRTKDAAPSNDMKIISIVTAFKVNLKVIY